MTILSLQTTLDGETIGQTAERRLHESPYYFLRTLHCRVDGGVLTLAGRVPHSQLRPIAEAIVSRVEGVHTVVNCVEVYDPQRASA